MRPRPPVLNGSEGAEFEAFAVLMVELAKHNRVNSAFLTLNDQRVNRINQPNTPKPRPSHRKRTFPNNTTISEAFFALELKH